MTTVSKATHGNRGVARLARCLTVMAICVFAVATWSSGQVEAKKFGKNLSILRILFLAGRIKHLEKRAHELSTRECQTGMMDFSICPGFKETSPQVITTCVVSPIAGAGVNVSDMTVTFAEPFKKKPIVHAIYSGIAFVIGINTTLEVRDVQEGQFTVRQVADDYLPVATQASFFACPSALR